MAHYLRSIYVDHPKFWKQSRDYELAEGEERAKLGKQVMDTFVKESGTMPVNIPATQRVEVENACSDGVSR